MISDTRALTASGPVDPLSGLLLWWLSLMVTSSVAEVALELAPWQQLQRLLYTCYPRPPQ